MNLDGRLACEGRPRDLELLFHARNCSAVWTIGFGTCTNNAGEGCSSALKVAVPSKSVSIGADIRNIDTIDRLLQPLHTDDIECSAPWLLLIDIRRVEREAEPPGQRARRR